MMKSLMYISFMIILFMVMMMFIMKQNFLAIFSQQSSVECGFNSLSEKNFKFSNHFFLIAIIFVIFDMELIIILPIPEMKMSLNNMAMLMMIMIIIMFSLIMEWLSGTLEWIKS